MTKTSSWSRKRNDSAFRRIKAHPKVRTGCLTCSVSTGRHCDGYPSDSFKNAGSEALSDPREIRSIQYFHENTVRQLSGYFDRHFWTVLVPQIADESPAIKRCLVAIGALHEALEISYSTWLHTEAEPIQLFALEQYNKSIALLTAKDAAAPSVRVLLVSCILFVCIQVLQRKPSVELVQKGLHVLRLWQNSRGCHPAFSNLDGSSNAVENEILLMLSRLGVDRATFVQFSSAKLYGAAEQPSSSLTMTQEFKDLYESRAFLDNLMTNLFSTAEPFQDNNNVTTTAEIVNRFIRYLDCWWSAFQRLLGNSGPMKDDAYLAALLLHVHYHVARIEVCTRLHNDQMLFDHHLDNFRAIVHFAGECLRAIKLSSDPSSKNVEDAVPQTSISFGLEPGTVSALFWTGLHCRDPTVRREAIALMHGAHRREGAFDSKTAAKIVAMMVNIEENHPTTPPQPQRELPASARIVFLSGNFHGVDPEQSRPMAVDEEVLESREKTKKGKEILCPAKLFKRLLPYPNNLMICRYVKQPWKEDVDVTEIVLDLNDDIALPGYSQPSPSYNFQPVSRQRYEEVERLSNFYRDEVSPEDIRRASAASTAMLEWQLDQSQPEC